jgi:hypothetical protein
MVFIECYEKEMLHKSKKSRVEKTYSNKISLNKKYMHLIKKALIILTDRDSLGSISDAFSGNLSQGNNWTRLFS